MTRQDYIVVAMAVCAGCMVGGLIMLLSYVLGL